MPYTYAEFKEKVSDIVRDDAVKLTPEEKDRFIQEALKTYSRHKPREIVKDITGDGAYDYSIATHLTFWSEEFSSIKSIEYPADERDPVYLDDDEYMIIRKETGLYLRFLEVSPSAAQKIRVIYIGLHILSDSQNTIPGIHEDALCNLAASLCSGALASAYAHTSDSTITADSVDHMSKSREFAARAKAQKQNYLDQIGIKEGEVPPASVIKDVKTDYPGGGDRLTHPKKWR